jgi:thioredoxin 1
VQVVLLEKLMPSKNVQIFNDLNFDFEVQNAPGKVLVQFTASWCGPCKRLAPIVDDVADQLAGKIKVGRLDVDESPITASKFQVRGVPTLKVFEGGRPVQQSVGLVSKAKVLSLVGGD